MGVKECIDWLRKYIIEKRRYNRDLCIKCGINGWSIYGVPKVPEGRYKCDNCNFIQTRKRFPIDNDKKKVRKDWWMDEK